MIKLSFALSKCLSLLIVLLATSDASALQATDKPSTDQGQFLKQCAHALAAFTNEDADAPDSDRLFELVMTAEVSGKTDLADKLKRALLIHKIDSLQAKYVLLNLKDAGALKSLMLEEFKSRSQNLDLDFCRKYCRVMNVGLHRFGPGLLHDDILLQTTLAADISRDLSLMVQCREKLRRSDSEDIRSIEKIAFGRTLSAQERFIQLQPFHENVAVRIIQTQFYRIMEEKQRQDPVVRSILAENSLLDYRNDEALLVISKLLDDLEHPNEESESNNDLKPKLLCWKAMALIRLSRPQEALESLKQQIKECPANEWTVTSKVMLDALADHEAALEERVELTGKVIQRILGTNCDRIEVEMSATSDGTSTGKSCLISLDTSQAIFQFQLVKNDVATLIFQADKEKTKLYLGGEPQIRQTAKGVFPFIQLSLKEAESGGFTFGFNFNIANDARAAKASLFSFLSSPIVSTEEGRRRLLKYDRKRGALFPKPETIDGHIRLVTLTPKVSEPGFSRSEAIIDDDDKLVRFSSDWLTMDRIRYGASEDFPLRALSFPECKTIHQKSFDMSVFASLIGTVFEFFGDDEETDIPSDSGSETQTAKKTDSSGPGKKPTNSLR